MITIHFRRLMTLFVSAFLMTAVFVFGTALPAAAYSCTQNYLGDGSQANPWQIATSDQLDCFAATYTRVPAGGGDAYFIQTADVSRNTNISIYPSSGAPHFHYNGQGHTISIENVTNFSGLFVFTDGDDVRNLHISSVNSTLATGAGWFAGQDSDSTFTNVSADGDISSGGGGIVGIGFVTTIDNSYTTGAIGSGGGGLVGTGDLLIITNSYSTGIVGPSAGGLVGQNSQSGNISRSFSSGLIGAYGGGIVGSDCINMVLTNVYSTGAISSYAGGIIGAYTVNATITNAYSLGNISAHGGGILGADSDSSTVSNAYAAGLIDPQAGGIVGANAGNTILLHGYSAQGALLAPGATNSTVTNSTAGSGPFSATTANTVLSPLSAWADCSSVQTGGYYLTAITPVNPCVTPSPTPAPTVSPAALAITAARVDHQGLVGYSLLALCAFVGGVTLILAARKNSSR